MGRYSLVARFSALCGWYPGEYTERTVGSAMPSDKLLAQLRDTKMLDGVELRCTRSATWCCSRWATAPTPTALAA